MVSSKEAVGKRGSGQRKDRIGWIVDSSKERKDSGKPKKKKRGMIVVSPKETVGRGHRANMARIKEGTARRGKESK